MSLPGTRAACHCSQLQLWLLQMQEESALAARDSARYVCSSTAARVNAPRYKRCARYQAPLTVIWQLPDDQG